MGIRDLLRKVFGRSRATTADDSATPEAAVDPAPEPGETEAAATAVATEEPAPKPRARRSADDDTPPDPALAEPLKTLDEILGSPTDAPAPTAKPAAEPEPKADTAPAAATEAESKAEAAPAAEAETAGAAEPEPAPATEATAEAKPKAEAPEAKAPKGPKAEATEVDPAPAAEAEPTAPEPEAPAEAKPKATAAPAKKTAKAQAKKPAPAAKAEPAKAQAKKPAPAAAKAGAAEVQEKAPGLVGLYTAAAEAIEKQGMTGTPAVVYLVLDRSGSMRNYFKDGTVQHLADQAVALATNLSTGTVPVVFFSTDIDGTAEIDLANHSGRIEELHGALGHMGRTNYHTAIDAVIDHYKKSGATDPALVIFQTDGAPTGKPAAEKALCAAAGLPLFWQFIAFGDPEAKGFDFLRKLDSSAALAVPEKRAVDNTGFFHAGLDPRAVADTEVFEQLVRKFPEWLVAARAAGAVKG
ncbi:VWA domain-containing protein [Streptomyces sp. NPDC048636]|uniref:VWA domain-containing protein n=1 Tax=Streptomyces sp. NPDC048636 TaxID=3155762 RepID=UPI00344251C6